MGPGVSGFWGVDHLALNPCLARTLLRDFGQGALPLCISISLSLPRDNTVKWVGMS